MKPSAEEIRRLLDQAYGLGAKNAYLWMRRKPGVGPQLQDTRKMNKERDNDLEPLVAEAMASSVLIGLPVIDPDLLDTSKERK